MERISDYQGWAGSVAFQRGPRWLSNLYMLPNQLQILAQEGRLRGEHLPDGGVLLLTDEGEYDCLHFRVKEELLLPKQHRPVLAEVVYRDGNEQQKRIEALLLSAGFHLRTRCVQFSGSLSKAISHAQVPDGYRIGTATEKAKHEILTLWDMLLSPYDFRDGSKLYLGQRIEQGRIACVWDHNNSVCAVSCFDVQGGHFFNRHVVVHPAHQGKGLGSILMQLGENYAISHGCVSTTAWVAEDNVSSLAMHSRSMKQTDRKLAQYVLE